MASQRRYSFTHALVLGFVAGVAGYSLLLLGVRFAAHVSYVAPSPDLSLQYVFFLLTFPIGTILSIGVPVTVFLYRQWIGPLIGLGLLVLFWLIIAMYSGDATPFGIAPMFWILYLSLYAGLAFVIDVLIRQPHKQNCTIGQ